MFIVYNHYFRHNTLNNNKWFNLLDSHYTWLKLQITYLMIVTIEYLRPTEY